MNRNITNLIVPSVIVAALVALSCFVYGCEPAVFTMLVAVAALVGPPAILGTLVLAITPAGSLLAGLVISGTALARRALENVVVLDVLVSAALLVALLAQAAAATSVGLLVVYVLAALAISVLLGVNVVRPVREYLARERCEVARRQIEAYLEADRDDYLVDEYGQAVSPCLVEFDEVEFDQIPDPRPAQGE